MKFICFLLVLWATSLANAQLVNVESKRMQTDSTRFVLKSDLLFNYTDNNGVYVLQMTSNISTQFKSRDFKDLYFLVMNYNLVRSQDQDFQNAWFFHVRYNRYISDIVRIEAFAQNQNNTRLTIVQRNLTGAGVRLKLLDKENTKLYFGNSYMYEIEKIAASEERLYNHRNSTYLSINQTFESLNLDLIGTAYFQPLYRDIANYRALCQLKAEIPLTNRLSLSALYNYSYIGFSSNLSEDSSANINLGLSFSL